jgi:hypothetical protein
MPLSDIELRALGRPRREGTDHAGRLPALDAGARRRLQPAHQPRARQRLPPAGGARRRAAAPRPGPGRDRAGGARPGAEAPPPAGAGPDLRPTELALLAGLMLRGPQTAAELRARAERYGGIPDLAGVEPTLAAMAAAIRRWCATSVAPPGQSQDRWAHVLGTDEERLQPRVRAVAAARHDRTRASLRRRPLEAVRAPSSRRAWRSSRPHLVALTDRVAALEDRLEARDEPPGAGVRAPASLGPMNPCARSASAHGAHPGGRRPGPAARRGDDGDRDRLPALPFRCRSRPAACARSATAPAL